MIGRFRRQTRVPARTILAAVVMLAGVLVVAFGHYGGYSAAITAGLIIILAGVLLELLFTAFGHQHRYVPRVKH